MPEAEARLDGRRILVVEDSYMMAAELASLLRRSGAEIVGPVRSVARACALIETERQIDGAILDVNLAGEWCFPVAEALVARATPFVFTTGYDSTVLPMPYGRTPCFIKPIEPEALVRALAR